MKRLLLTAAIILTILLTGCSSKDQTLADKYRGKSAEQIYKKAQIDVAKGSFKDAVSELEALDTLYPFSPYEQQAQLDIIYAYYKSEDFASAAAAATRYIHLYPRSQHVDYAYFMKGMAHYAQNRGFTTKYFPVDLSQRDLSTTKQAYDDFSDLMTRFPTSHYVPNAQARMVYLRNMMANHELNIARYYYTHDAYVAAINRSDAILQHYQQSPAVIPALGIIVNSYQQLKLYQLSDKALQVLAYNYPKSEIYQDIMQQRAKQQRKRT